MAAQGQSAGPAHYSVVVWEWQNDLSLWEPYDPQIVDYVEMSYQTNPTTPAQLGVVSPSLAAYVADFTSGLQRSMRTSHARGIRRRIIASNDPGGVGQGIVWQWQDDLHWRSYPLELSAMIEVFRNSLQPNASSVIDAQTRFHTYPYLIDVLRCVQTKKNTNFKRQIRRVTTMHYRRWNAGMTQSANVTSTANISNGLHSVATSVPNSSSASGPAALPVPSSGPVPNSNGVSTTSTSSTPAGSMAPKRARASASANGVANSNNANDYSWRLAHPPPSSSMHSVSNNARSQNANAATGDLIERFTTPVSAEQVATDMSDDDCNICMDKLAGDSSFGDDSTVGRLSKCGHVFHRSCLRAMMASDAAGSIRCPQCKRDHGERRGICPLGRMEYHVIPGCAHAQGFPDARATICVVYRVKNGKQGPEHPNPGRPYHATGFPRTGFLPDNPKGRLVLQLLIIAWERRLTFTVGTSVTTGSADSVIWNEIHHKTGSPGHSFPDPNYIDNVIAELASQGVSTDDLPPTTTTSSDSANRPSKSPRLA